jgi:hypothetical protein
MDEASSGCIAFVKLVADAEGKRDPIQSVGRAVQTGGLRGKGKEVALNRWHRLAFCCSIILKVESREHYHLLMTTVRTSLQRLDDKSAGIRFTQCGMQL